MIFPGFLLPGVFMSGHEKGDADEENSNFFARLILCVDWCLQAMAAGRIMELRIGRDEAKVNVLDGSAQFLQAGK